MEGIVPDPTQPDLGGNLRDGGANTSPPGSGAVLMTQRGYAHSPDTALCREIAAWADTFTYLQVAGLVSLRQPC